MCGDLEDDEDPTGGLLCGLTPYHIRLLVDDPWVGGCGYGGDPGALTIDQMMMRLVDRKGLKAKDGGGVKATPLSMAVNADEKGMVRGRAVDGTSIKGKIGGKSLARQLMEEEAAKKQKTKRRRRSK